MKITCNSCGSKYTIADAKVQGKKVKVRCKGCGENILVDGSADGGSSEPSDPNATEVADEDQSPAEVPTAAAKKGLWSVNLSDDDSRDMTLQELVAAWRAGVVTQDAYVWKDGMGDWKPILEVGELKLKLGPAPKKGAPGVVSSAGAGAKAPRADKMDDLFGGADADNKPEPAKPATGGATDKATGARNDSSVLFSLDSLNQPAAADKPQAAAVDIFGGMGGGIGTLGASNVDLLTAPAKDPPPAPAGARLAPAVAAMPMAAPAPKSKTGLIIGVAIAAVVLIGGGVFAMSGSDDGSAEVDEKLKAAEAEAEKARKEAEEAKQKIEEERKKLEEEKKKALEEAKKSAEAPKTDDKKEEEKKEEEAKPGATTKPGTSPGTTAAPATDPAPAASGKPPFDVGAAKAALAAAAANAAGCRKPGGPTGSGRVQLTFGTSGRVSSASVVSGPFGGTAVGGCIVSGFRNARVPAFTGTPQTVSKSFSVK
jgi:predicted Zn finger-like uncharacterized protein